MVRICIQSTKPIKVAPDTGGGSNAMPASIACHHALAMSASVAAMPRSSLANSDNLSALDIGLGRAWYASYQDPFWSAWASRSGSAHARS